MPLSPEEVRRSFPAAGDRTFLDAACVSLAPRQAAEAIADFVELATTCPARDASALHIAMDERRRATVPLAARLLDAPEDQIALVESTTHGLNVAAAALPLGEGDEVLVPDTEFLQVAIPWMKRAERAGIVVRPVRHHDGRLAVDRFEEAWTPRTRVVCVSSVQWASGFRVDVAELHRLCRERDAWLVVDAVQELGAMVVRVNDRPADVVVAGGHKWLNAPFGCGVLYLSERFLAETEPVWWGYLALEEPEGGWPQYFRTPSITPFREYRFPKTAHSHEIGGTSNYPGAVGLGASIGLLLDVGVDAVEAHVRRLTDRLHAGLADLGVRVVTDPRPEARSGITVFRTSDDPEDEQRLLEALLDERIYVSVRYTAGVGGIRVSTHLYNTADDVDRLLAAIARYRAS